MMASPLAAAPARIDQTESCDVLVVGGGLAGVATAYESLRAGRTVCLTELTDWLGGQLTSQGTTALDEAQRQRQLLFYATGYKELRQRVLDHYGRQNPGDCWVSAVCFLPADAHDILVDMLDEAAHDGDGTLKWFPSTVVKEVNVEGTMIESAIAIQHSPAPGTPPLNTDTLSAFYEDTYRYEDSERLSKKIIRFQPNQNEGPADWYVVEATETGEVIALAGVPYNLGLDPKSYLNPSSPTLAGDAYCTQGFTYTFAMERTEEPQPQEPPAYYDIYAPYFSFERQRDNTNYIDFVFTYRRLLAPGKRPEQRAFGVSAVKPGDISMQNWTWGNDYRPGTFVDNLIYSHDQLEAAGQLNPGGWLGGLRIETLRRGEENAFSYYHWLVAGLTDSQLGDDVKDVDLRHRFLTGFDAPMNTAHGLSKHPYIREGRRIVGRPA
ncbi:MAG: FAD-dependent oxidoreductase, partial [Cyanobacteria bacterium P01_H01_bin.105]